MRKIKNFGLITIISTTLLYSALSINRNYLWKNEYTLYSDAVEKSPNKGRTHGILGQAYREYGILDKAIEEFKKATVDMCLYCSSGAVIINLHNLAAAYIEKGMLDNALNEYNRLLKNFPLNTIIIKVSTQQAEIKIKNLYSDIYGNLALIYHQKGESDKEFYAKKLSTLLKVKKLY